ncbi:MAG: hypothetical protein KatS3mg031_1718 [Chitinophagales bacterium]|nr:MAG: hypothetical protein KatS3mg031_1718 [Chitinophagales bacterium]
MGKRKHMVAEARKEALKSVAIARFRNIPTSTRKMRVVADTIRGKPVEQALNLLMYSKREASRNMEKLLRTAIRNWELKNEGQRVEDSQLYVKTVFVDQGVTLKRFQPAPQGRAYRIRKRSNHITLIVDSKIKKQQQEEAATSTPATETTPATEAEQKVKTGSAKPAKTEGAPKTKKAASTTNTKKKSDKSKSDKNKKTKGDQ